MACATRPSILLCVLLLLPLGDALAQSQLEKACIAEIRSVEARIAAARKLPEYRSEYGNRLLSSADRWVYQARKHAVKGESRSCVSAAQKGGAQLAAR